MFYNCILAGFIVVCVFWEVIFMRLSISRLSLLLGMSFYPLALVFVQEKKSLSNVLEDFSSPLSFSGWLMVQKLSSPKRCFEGTHQLFQCFLVSTI